MRASQVSFSGMPTGKKYVSTLFNQPAADSVHESSNA